jgi:hypothetical protein
MQQSGQHYLALFNLRISVSYPDIDENSDETGGCNKMHAGAGGLGWIFRIYP